MNYLGFFIGNHDSNATVVKNGKIYYEKSERNKNEKHHRAEINWIDEIKSKYNIEPDQVCVTDGNRNDLGECSSDNLFAQHRNLHVIDHHFAHILSAFPIVDMQQVNWGISIDGRGDNERRISIIKNPGTNPENVWTSQHKSISKLLTIIGEKMGLGGQPIDLAGKVMGLQAYGEVNQDFVDQCKKLFEEQDPLLIPFLVPWHSKLPWSHQITFNAEDQEFRNWLASIHMVCQEYVLHIFRKFCKPDDLIVYTGGVAQNTVINMAVRREFPNLVIPPHAYDGGLSLGCVEFLRARYGGPDFDTSYFPYWQQDECPEDPRDEIIEDIADCLADGQTVGWFQGGGEIGPRALGHRSLLFDPRHENGKEIVNRIKKREWWRPYAGSVLQTKASTFFELDDSPYMLYACGMKMPDIMPAIRHVDDTCRIQTVEDNPRCGYAKLLKAFEQRTGIPILLNTSLNTGGKPIVGTQNQAIQMFEETEMDVLCMGNKVIKKHS